MRVLTLDNYEVKIAPEALQLTMFRNIWERDKSKDKNMARMELAYVYFMEDVRSDYLEIADRDARSNAIQKEEGLPANWKPDKTVKEACEYYRSKQPEQTAWLESERVFIGKLQETMLNINPGAVDKEGKLINPLTQTAQLVTTFNKAIIDYTETQKKVFSDVTLNEKVRGSQDKADFEDLNI
jgi:hypothetical protein